MVDALLGLDAGERGLVLPQLKGFVDSPWEALPFLRLGDVEGAGGG